MPKNNGPSVAGLCIASASPTNISTVKLKCSQQHPTSRALIDHSKEYKKRYRISSPPPPVQLVVGINDYKTMTATKCSVISYHNALISTLHHIVHITFKASWKPNVTEPFSPMQRIPKSCLDTWFKVNPFFMDFSVSFSLSMVKAFLCPALECLL